MANELRSQPLERIFMWLRHSVFEGKWPDYTETARRHKHQSCHALRFLLSRRAPWCV